MKKTSDTPRFYSLMPSPIGELLLVGGDSGLEEIRFEPRGGEAHRPEAPWRREQRAFAPALFQLERYFAGKLREFDLSLAPRGTPFQLRVWRALATIPYGSTWSYGELARHIGRPGAARAVGAANGANLLPIVLPCHRVIGADGSLTGFGGGLEMKEELLRLEREHSGGSASGAGMQPELRPVG